MELPGRQVHPWRARWIYGKTRGLVRMAPWGSPGFPMAPNGLTLVPLASLELHIKCMMIYECTLALAVCLHTRPNGNAAIMVNNPETHSYNNSEKPRNTQCQLSYNQYLKTFTIK